MITPKLTSCSNCADAQELIDEINCRIFELAKIAYNNSVYGLNLNLNTNVAMDLLHYRDILTYKNVNPNYACHYSINQIASKVKLLIHK